MKVVPRIILRMPPWVWKFLSNLTGSRERDIEDERRRSILAFLLILSIGVALPFATNLFIIGNVTRAIFLLCLASVQFTSLMALRYLRHANIIFRLNVILLGIYFLFLVSVGGTHGSRIFWVLTFPIIAFFLLGKREGLFFCVILILFSLLLLVDPANFFKTFPYPSEIKTRFIITCTLLTVLGYFSEATRQKYQEVFQDHAGFQSTLATIRGLGPDKSEADFWQVFLSSIVKEYGFLMAWYGSYSDGQVVPEHSAGRVDRYLDDLVLKIHEPTSPDARCAMSRAIIDGQPFGYEDLAHDKGFHSWQDYALELGYCSNVALPFRVNGRIEGGIMIYAGTVAAFPAKRVEHLRFLTSEMENILHERRLAQQAKVALQKSYDELEKRVEERTAELREVNERLKKEIIERQSTEEELRSSERRLSDIINFLPDPTFVIDLEGKVIAWNHATEELTGIGAEEMVGKGDYEYSIPFYGHRRPILINLALQWDEETAEQYEYVKREGSTLVSETRNPPFRKEASQFWNTARPLHNANGDIIGAIEVIRDITERVKAATALKEAYDIINKSPTVAFLWKNEEGWPVEFVSENVKDLFGYTARDFTSGKVPYTPTVHHDDLARVSNEVTTFSAEEGRKTFAHEPYRILTKNGEVKWVDDRTYIRRDDKGRITHYQGIVEDITERKKAEELLRTSEANYRTLFESGPDGIIIVDLDTGIIVDANSSISELYGYTHAELCGLAAVALSAEPEISEVHIEAITKEMHGGPIAPVGYRRHRKKDGTEFPVEILHGFYNRDGRPMICAIMRDITERKETERELALHREQLEELVKMRTRELEVAQDELMKKERLSVLGQLTATVSHELRNPLGVIRSSSFYLQQKCKEPDEKVNKHINRIEDQVEICDSIVGDLLEYTRGRHSQMEKGKINPWIKEILDELPQDEDVQLTKVLAENLPRIHFDKEKMRRVVVNLMDNALQAIKERIQMGKNDSYRPAIEVSSTAKNGGIVIMIKDNGIGMDKDTIERAFEPLFTTRARGTGLGLANVEKILHEHKGSIILESKPHKGTTVIITLPAMFKE